MIEHKETKEMSPEKAVALGYAATGYGKDKKAKGEAPDAAAAGIAQDAEEAKPKEADAPKLVAVAVPIEHPQMRDHKGRLLEIPKEA